MNTLADWQYVTRQIVRGWLEDATHQAFALDATLPDSLIAAAQEIGMLPVDLRIWIYDQPKQEWSQDAMKRFAERFGLTHAA